MPTVLKTPGVYVEEIVKFPPSVAQVETAIPAFIGYTEKATDKNANNLQNVPTRITSLLEYENYFGKAAGETGIEMTLTEETNPDGSLKEAISVSLSKPSPYVMYYAMQLYFANGGGPCYVVSVASYKAPATDPALTDLQAGLDAVEKEDEPTLIVFPEGQKMKEAEYFTFQSNALAQCRKLGDRFCIIDLFKDDIDKGVKDFRSKIVSDRDLVKYGAAYFPNVITVFPYLYDETKVKIKHSNGAAAAALNGKTLNEVAPLNTASYNKLKAALNEYYVTLSPAAAIAGVYARVDSTRGVWKAPANVSLNAVSGLTFKVTNELQEALNVDTTSGKSINCIRAFTGKGTLVWGARTLAGNDNEWRYVPVRRLFNMVEESCKKATEQFVFEPNDANTWIRVRAMIENFLTVLWRDGAFAGAKPEHAFYVACGLNQTMTAQDVLEGKLIVEIGLAAVRPAEFIVLRFSHKMQES